MSVDGLSNCGADDLAANLFTTLTTGENFTLPVVDLTGAQFTIPVATDNPLYSSVTALTEADLTTRVVGGDGMFDALMASISLHLKAEYSSNRLTGKDFAESYVQLTTAALSASVQYLLARDQAYWQATLAQRQAQAAEVLVVSERVNLETTKARLKTSQAEARVMATTFALSQMKLATEDAQYCGVKAQTTQTEYQTASIMPAQLAQVNQETARLTYEVTNLLPAELTKSQKQVEVASSEISFTTARKDQVLYQTANIAPAEKAGVEADTALKAYQLANQLPAQVAGITADNVGKAFTNEFILPAQLENLDEQVEANRAKTLDTRTDGVTPVAGAIGKQKDLHQQQIESYNHDAQAKVAKMLLDTWMTQKSLDEGLTPPTSLSDANINVVMERVRANLELDT